MQVLKTRLFDRWAKEVDLEDGSLLKAVEEMESGLFDANLGGNVYKKRVPIGHRGKSGGARTILGFKLRDKAFFIYGFAKNRKENITKKEEDALKALAKEYFRYDEKQINRAIKVGELVEVKS
jgi:hypothetical protein